jgi:ribosomal protein S18 acetylase RimI-like enzyme
MTIGNQNSIRIEQDVDKAILVMRNAGKWLFESGKNPSKWWLLENLNKEFLFQYAEPSEFYVIFVGGKPAAAAIMQIVQRAQDWKDIGEDRSRSALYIHWLCVHRDFASQGFPKIMVNYASNLARANGVNCLRADTNADETKLRKIYESLGFYLVAVKKEDYRKTAFYQLSVV